MSSESRYAEGKPERLNDLAAELIKRGPDVVVAAASDLIRAARLATSTIPIVFPITGDPVSSGFVASLAHPGGNTTGLSILTNELGAKQLELLRQVVPGLSRVTVLGNSGA